MDPHQRVSLLARSFHPPSPPPRVSARSDLSGEQERLLDADYYRSRAPTMASRLLPVIERSDWVTLSRDRTTTIQSSDRKLRDRRHDHRDL